MKHSPRALTSLIKTAACAALMVGMAAHAQVNPTGTWTWTQPGRGGGPDRTNTLTLKFSDGKLTGEYTAPAGGRGGGGGGAPMPIAISDGKVDGSTISFNVVRELPNGGNSITNKYSGKLTADSIVGKIEGPAFGGGRRGGGGAGGAGGAPGGGAPGGGGAPQARDWTATKSK
jgi:hypothetical protein